MSTGALATVVASLDGLSSPRAFNLAAEVTAASAGKEQKYVKNTICTRYIILYLVVALLLSNLYACCDNDFTARVRRLGALARRARHDGCGHALRWHECLLLAQRGCAPGPDRAVLLRVLPAVGVLSPTGPFKVIQAPLSIFH